MTNTLKLWSKGDEVKCLQSFLGITADGNFGPKTKAKVVAFQKYNGLKADGIFGVKSRLKMANSANNISNLPVVTSNNTVNTSNNTVNTFVSGGQPIITSVSPEKVRSGDTIYIYGDNFSPINNVVLLRYGQIEAKFEHLSSNDRKTISFIYKPPEVKTMSKDELLNLPPEIFTKIMDPLKAVGGSIDDLVAPYRNISSEQELRSVLTNNNHSFDELYDKFYVTVQNINGEGSSNKAILTGLRKLSFGSNFAILDINALFSRIFDVFSLKKAYAQLPEGGYNSGIIMYCTCGSGYLTFMTDISPNGGTGLYWWPPGFIPSVGTAMIAGPQLGYYIKNAGTCVIESGPSCADITANLPMLPWGEGI